MNATATQLAIESTDDQLSDLHDLIAERQAEDVTYQLTRRCDVCWSLASDCPACCPCQERVAA
jgi:hypothetical protein